MNLDYLQYFVDAVEYRSITKAAAANNISQQGLSRAIQRLEAECKTDLVDRTKRFFAPSEAGQIFLKHAKVILEDYSHLQNDLQRFTARNQQWSRTVKVYSTVNISYHLWPMLSKELALRFPDVLFSVVDLPLDQVFNTIALEATDDVIGITSLPEIYHDNYLRTPVELEPLLDMRLMARVGKNSSLASQSIITRKDLTTHLLVLHDDEWLKSMLETITGVSLDKLGNVILRSNNTATIEENLRRYDAIGFANSFAYHYLQNSAFEILPIEGTIETPVYYLFNKLIANEPFIQELHTALLDIASQFSLAAEIVDPREIARPDQR